jgi:beta-galactosidase
MKPGPVGKPPADRSKTIVLLPTGDQGGFSWLYRVGRAPANWETPGFKPGAAWKEGRSGFGRPGMVGPTINTKWESPDDSDIYLRTFVALPAFGDHRVFLREMHDDGAEVYVNGRLLRELRGWHHPYRDHELTAEQKSLFREGLNLIAVHCHQHTGGQGIDVGFFAIDAGP